MIKITRHWPSLRAAFICFALFAGVVCTTRPADAAALASAAAVANSGLSACAGEAGKALYNCVANVLDRLGDDIAPASAGQTSRSLKSAAASLRSATTKSQALSAIARCQSFVANALRQVKASAERFVEGLGGGGLNNIANVLARASQLIQTKG
jgi:hypothetical protein